MFFLNLDLAYETGIYFLILIHIYGEIQNIVYLTQKEVQVGFPYGQ